MRARSNIFNSRGAQNLCMHVPASCIYRLLVGSPNQALIYSSRGIVLLHTRDLPCDALVITFFNQVFFPKKLRFSFANGPHFLKFGKWSSPGYKEMT